MYSTADRVEDPTTLELARFHSLGTDSGREIMPPFSSSSSSSPPSSPVRRRPAVVAAVAAAGGGGNRKNSSSSGGIAPWRASTMVLLLALLAGTTLVYVLGFWTRYDSVRDSDGATSPSSSSRPLSLFFRRNGESRTTGTEPQQHFRGGSKVRCRQATTGSSYDSSSSSSSNNDGREKRADEFDLSFTLKCSENEGGVEASSATSSSSSRHDVPVAIEGKLSTTIITAKKPKTKKKTSALPLCTRRQIIGPESSWQRALVPQLPYRTPTVHLQCPERTAAVESKSDSDSDGGSRRDLYYETWDWKIGNNATSAASTTTSNSPTGPACDFTKWRETKFCSLLSGGPVRILIAGDSLSWEHYASLVQLLGHKTRQGYQFQSKFLQQTVGQNVCPGNAVRIEYRRDDRLSNLSGALLQDGGGDDDSTNGSAAPPPTVLILNQGAHYMNDTLLLENLRSNVAAVEQWLDRCDQLQIKCHFFWRTTVPGHPHCSTDPTATSLASPSSSIRFDRPASNKTSMESYVEDMSNYDENTLKYHWYDFRRQNELVEEELGRLLPPRHRYRIIDAYHLNVLRPDQHRSWQGDCLHSCYPGKMDVYSRLLLHYLRLDRTSENNARYAAVASQRNWSLPPTTAYDPDATEAARLRYNVHRGEEGGTTSAAADAYDESHVG